MAQPMRWLWGLAPLALLWAVGNVALDDQIQSDVGRRAVASASKAAGEVPGARPLLARVAGRDVTIAGEALSSDGAAKAMAQLRSEFGVRRALGGLTQVVALKPYGWSASRQGQVVTLSGAVPDEATATANVAAAGAAVPGARIDDRQSLAFGAPEGFAAMTTALLPELGRLASGKLAIDDARFCIEGGATSPEAFLALRDAVKRLAGGFQAVDCSLEPPSATPYRWAVERDGGRVAVTGFYPSDALRQQVADLLRRAFPEPIVIEDRSLPALGAPAAFLTKVTRAVAELARLRDGRAAIDGDVYAITGQGPDDFAACQALRLQIAQLDGPDSVAQANIACPPAPPPLPPLPALPEIPQPIFLPADLAPAATEPAPIAPAAPAPAPVAATAAPTVVAPPPPPPVVSLRWQVTRGPEGLSINGLAPDEAAKAAIAQVALDMPGGAGLDDRTTLAPHLAPHPDFAASTRLALTLVGLLSRGTATLDGSVLSLAGEVADGDGWSMLQAALARQPLPAGLSLRADPASLAIRPYRLAISADKSGVRLSGYLPDLATRAALLGAIEASDLRGKTADTTVLLPSAPAGFGEVARLALVNLLRLDLGSADIGDDGALLRGLTCRDLIKSEVETSVAQAKAAGVAIEAGISLRQTGCVIDPPSTCQNDLDALTKRNTVLFGQGTTVVVLDPTTERVIGEAFGILKQCPASRITIEGHANRDGEARGFDNRDLSERRAFRVRDELVKRGVDPAQLAVTGFGSERPLVPHGAPEAKATNRRVQFTVAK
jgi:outer membrane protein OmpA-like peptidoglycan-associated protein